MSITKELLEKVEKFLAGREPVLAYAGIMQSSTGCVLCSGGCIGCEGSCDGSCEHNCTAYRANVGG